MRSCQHFSQLFSVTMALCLTLSVAFPRAMDNWESRDIQGQPRFAPLINSLFTSLIRSQIRHRGQLRVSRASSLLKRIGIAGLDNMDAITTSLDRARNRTGQQRMSVRLSMADLRRIMATGR